MKQDESACNRAHLSQGQELRSGWAPQGLAPCSAGLIQRLQNLGVSTRPSRLGASAKLEHLPGIEPELWQQVLGEQLQRCTQPAPHTVGPQHALAECSSPAASPLTWSQRRCWRRALRVGLRSACTKPTVRGEMRSSRVQHVSSKPLTWHQRSRWQPVLRACTQRAGSEMRLGSAFQLQIDHLTWPQRRCWRSVLHAVPWRASELRRWAFCPWPCLADLLTLCLGRLGLLQRQRKRASVFRSAAGSCAGPADCLGHRGHSHGSWPLSLHSAHLYKA